MSFIYHIRKTTKNDKDILLTDHIMEKRPKDRLNILLLGSGGRESAMAWKIAQSSFVENLYIAPGNGGTEAYGINVPEISVNDFEQIRSYCVDHLIDMIVVGPEDPLVKGLVDYFSEHMPHVLVIGPKAAAAHLEGSKEYSKGFMKKYKIPTAKYKAFSSEEVDAAEHFLDTLSAPYVIKADGLAAGKGVIIAETREEASIALQRLFELGSKSGENHVVIEEFLRGIECSVFIATDGESYKILPTVKDYKRIGDGDHGPNTGGMGSVSPILFDDKSFLNKVETRIIRPTIEGLKNEGVEYRGFLFFGLMNVDGDPYVIEYNCRLGDPETQSLMLRIKSDLGEMLHAIATRTLSHYQLEIDPRSAATVVLVSRGYPGSYKKGYEILLPLPPEDILIFHAGTTISDGKLQTSGGRVLAVSAYGTCLSNALDRCYTIAKEVLFEGKNYRHDIGADILALQENR